MQVLVNNEVTQVSSKTILAELVETKTTISRLTTSAARSVGWDTWLSAAMKERDDTQQERDSKSRRVERKCLLRLARSRCQHRPQPGDCDRRADHGVDTWRRRRASVANDSRRHHLGRQHPITRVGAAGGIPRSRSMLHQIARFKTGTEAWRRCFNAAQVVPLQCAYPLFSVPILISDVIWSSHTRSRAQRAPLAGLPRAWACTAPIQRRCKLVQTASCSGTCVLLPATPSAKFRSDSVSAAECSN
jgi:hypothetical protein